MIHGIGAGLEASPRGQKLQAGSLCYSTPLLARGGFVETPLLRDRSTRRKAVQACLRRITRQRSSRHWPFLVMCAAKKRNRWAGALLISQVLKDADRRQLLLEAENRREEIPCFLNSFENLLRNKLKRGCFLGADNGFNFLPSNRR
jgi:hypothetical protein